MCPGRGGGGGGSIPCFCSDRYVSWQKRGPLEGWGEGGHGGGTKNTNCCLVQGLSFEGSIFNEQ